MFVEGENSSIQKRHAKIDNQEDREAAVAAYGAAMGSRSTRLKAVAASSSRDHVAEKRQLWQACNPGEDVPGNTGVNEWIAGKGGVKGARAAAALALRHLHLMH